MPNVTDWRKRFVQKVDTVREASREQFEDAADRVLTPLFEEYREFITQQGFSANSPVAKPGLRTFKFAIAENAYVLMAFRLRGLEQCELESECIVPGAEKLSPFLEEVDLSDLDTGWARRMFESCLDRFMDAYVELYNADELAEMIKG